MSQTNNQPEPITSFSDFIDLITNKLTVYGIFNALLIFSLSLKEGTGQLFLFFSSLMLNFLLLILIINICFKKCTVIYEQKTEAMYYGFFIAFIFIAFLGLLIYSITKYPSVTEIVFSTVIFYLTSVVVYQVFRLIEKFRPIKYSGIVFILVSFLVAMLIAVFFLSDLIMEIESLINFGN